MPIFQYCPETAFQTIAFIIYVYTNSIHRDHKTLIYRFSRLCFTERGDTPSEVTIDHSLYKIRGGKKHCNNSLIKWQPSGSCKMCSKCTRTLCNADSGHSSHIASWVGECIEKHAMMSQKMATQYPPQKKHNFSKMSDFMTYTYTVATLLVFPLHTVEAADVQLK